jgi:pimeloyl-ACP methyl ester carboxylesterase
VDEPRRIDLGRITLAVFEAGPADGPLVVLLHGFPELAYSWRHQIGPLAQAGYRVLAPDLRGVGGSDRPEDVAAYAVTELAADVVALIDHARREQAVVIGHDWGADAAWKTAWMRPERVAAVAGFSVPFIPRAWHFCAPADPQAKGVVERLQGYAETTFEPARVFANELDVQDQLDAWSAKVNAHAHKTLRARPVDAPRRRAQGDGGAACRDARHRPALDDARRPRARAGPCAVTGARCGRRGLVVRAGDCRSPRGLDEAILEGTLAVRESTSVPAGGGVGSGSR